MNKKDIPFFIENLNKLFPDAKTELYYNNPFQLLIAIMMSAQATDKQVNKVNKIFFEQLIKPKDVKNIGIEKIKSIIKTISFFNNKAKNIYKTCLILEEKFDSIPPDNIENLITLPGVGIKTAKVYLAIIHDAPHIGVDTHVHRVLNRLGFVKTKTPLETDKKISTYFTKQNNAMLHNTLVLFGRYICTAKKPKCEKCPFFEKCGYKDKKY